jgi:hypothetical protein
MKKVKLFLFISLLVFTACKASKHIASNTEQVQSIQKTDEKAVNIHESTTVTGNENTQVNEDVLIYRREYYQPVPGDTSPPVLKSEEWRGINKKQEQNKVTGSETNLKIEADYKSAEDVDTSIRNTTDEKKETYSRPVQGVEWVWIVVGIGIIAGIVLLVFYIKKRYL